MQSASSIKIYKTCPRKYYYQYIKKLPTKPSIHLIRGNITHKVLEEFFEIDVNTLTNKNFKQKLKNRIQKLLIHYWKKSSDLLSILDISNNSKIKYFEETMLMLLKWVDDFCNKLEKQQGTLQERFKKLTPLRELYYKSDVLSVQGFIDAIEHVNGEVRLMDYKTSNNFDIEEHKLQLAIYTTLYYEKHGRLPDKVGIYYLKMGECLIDCDHSLVELAKKEVMEIHEKTISEKIENYPKKPGPLCKWSNGCCDFYHICKPFDNNKN